MNGHHLILGELTDFITGQAIQDTLDERLRQNIAHLLVETKGFAKVDIRRHTPIEIRAGDRRAVVYVDFLIAVAERTGMLIQFGPGSLITRHRPTVALSRLAAPYQIPFAVVTNGKDAHVLDGVSARCVRTGIGAIPTEPELRERLTGHNFHPIPAQRAEKEARIVYAYEVDGACPCDDTICRLD